MNSTLQQSTGELHRAVEAGDLTAVQAALTAGADVNGILGDWAPLHRAAATGDSTMVRTLLEAGAEIE